MLSELHINARYYLHGPWSSNYYPLSLVKALEYFIHAEGALLAARLTLLAVSTRVRIYHYQCIVTSEPWNATDATDADAASIGSLPQTIPLSSKGGNSLLF
jgi:hypothetical protein